MEDMSINVGRKWDHYTLLGSVYLRVILNLSYTLLGSVYLRVTFNLFYI